MLRSRFHQHSNTGTWEQLVVPAETNAFSVEEHVYHDEQSFQDTVQSRQAVLNLQHGPLFVADLFSKEGEEQSLLLSAHHIIIDLVSWRIIWHDISKSLGTGGRMTPPAVSFQTWCRVQEEEGRTLVPDQVLPYNVEAAQMEYWGLETGDNRFSDSDTHEHILDAKSTALLLGSSNDSLRTETLDILIGAMAYSFRKVFADRSAPAIFLEGHGREPVAGVDTDIAETVGWFTTLCPVPISGNSTDSLVDTIRVAKDTRARVPGKGRPYIACRYHSTAGREAFNNHRDVEILLNYRGVFQQLENSGSLLQREDRPGRSVTIQEFGSEYQRMALVEINIVVEAGRARISTMTHKRMRHQDRLQHWLTLFPETLQAAADDLLVPSHRPTLADMPLLSISYVSLDALLTEQLTTRGVALSAIRDIYPCTPIQEGILLSSKRGVASYRNSWVWRCSSSKGSPISFQGLVAAWKTTARRHSVFSTIFASHPDTGRYIQVLLRDSDPRCVCISVETSKSATQYLLDMESPATGSASQAEYLITVCQGRGQEVACRLDMSHALIDASSIPVLLRDLASHYAGQGEDRREPPPFSEIVSHIEQINPTSSRVAYWQAHLAGAWKCELLGDLPVHIRQADSGYHYGVIPLATTQNTTIATWCREQNATRAVFLQVAWALVLALFTGITESCFGYVCSGRDTPIDQIEAVVGPLISMLVARIDLSPPQLESVLTAVGEQSIEHLSHQHTLLAEIQHALGSGPLFNTAITVREAHQYGNEDGLRLEEMREEDPDEYDVLLSAILDGDETEISIQYRSDFMSTGFAQNIARALHFAIAYLSRSPSAFYTSRSTCQSYFEYIAGADEQSSITYWLNRFEGLESAEFPSLPTANYQPQADTTTEYLIRDIQWSESYKLQPLVQAAWASVQAAHVNSDDVWFGTLFCKAPPTPLQLAMVLPTRAVLSRETMISELLDHLRSESSRPVGLSAQRVRLLSEEAARACQFQTLLVLIDIDSDKIAAEKLESKVTGRLLPSRPVALTIHAFVDRSELRIQAKFDPRAIESKRVSRMLQQFECALRWLRIPAHLHCRVSEIETISNQDLDEIWAWNTAVPEPVNSLVHDLFAQTVARHPEAPAISVWNGELTYQALDHLSTQLALYLVHLGVEPCGVVPIYIEKSLWTPVAQLAVMKSGGASVLLDSTQPTERARAIMQQVKPDVLIASPALEALASTLGAPDLIVLDWSLFEKIQQIVCGRSLLSKSVPSDVLYIVFTSGSTGTPKGAMISHGNFAAAIHHQQRALEYTGPGLRVYDFVSYAFDVAWSNALHSLTSGACLCIPSDAQRKDDLIGSLQGSKAALVDLTPSVLRLLKPRDLTHLRQVLLSGESFTKADLGDWVKHPGLLNTYGPAECSVKATMAPVNPVSTYENNIG